MINAYYIKTDGEQEGPFTHIELMEKGISPNTLVLSPLEPDWHYAVTLPELKGYFESEGIYYPTYESLASFWWRLLAYLIDYVLLMVLAAVIGFAIGLIWRYTGVYIPLFEKGSSYDLGYRFSLFVLLVLYNATFESIRAQGSIGKIICRLKVVDEDGVRVSFIKALVRNLSKLVSSLVCGMGFFAILWNDSKQGWHDQIAKTYIVRVKN